MIADIALAVTEAASNAVRHSGDSHFTVRCWAADHSLIVSVTDHGHGNTVSEPGLGLGKRIIRDLAVAVDFEATNPGTRVTMQFDR